MPPALMDQLWAGGWRHFGPRFFRYSLQYDEAASALQLIQPLRVDLPRFAATKSQRRVLARNSDLEWEIIPARAGADVQALFQLHKTRFRTCIPDTLFDFIAKEDPAARPCECLEFRALLGGRLIAASFLALGQHAASSIYGMFHPDFATRSPGVLTLLKEIEHSRALGHRHYYPGYATRESSAYDYKKRLPALEALDWTTGNWQPP